MGNSILVGVLGGMGPEATIDFMTRVLNNTPAQDDEDHIRMLVDHNPKVPSRIQALIDRTGESPAPVLKQMAKRLETGGADFLAMPCNTSHYYLPEIRKSVEIPVLDMIKLTGELIRNEKPGVHEVGLFASTAVVDLRLYPDAFEKYDIQVTNPSPGYQRQIMEIIRGVKRKEKTDTQRNILQEVLQALENSGAEVIVIGCTELSVLFGQMHTDTAIYDASEVLAKEVVNRCLR